MKKWIKWGLLVLVVGLLGVWAYVRYGAGMDLPEGEQGKEADMMAMRMLDAVGETSWNETRYVQWTFAGQNSYLWDRTQGKVLLKQGDRQIMLQTSDQKGWAKEGEEVLTGEDLDDALQGAWGNFCNDSFWLIAPLKVMDPGTERRKVETEEGDALLVTYTGGGVTPGDSYLWYMADDNLPYAFRMWVDILPTPGVKVTWENWTSLHTGVKIAQSHMMGPVNVAISHLASGSELSELGIEGDPFQL